MARSNGDETRDEEWIVQLNRDVGVTELARDWVTKVDAQLGKLKRWRNQSIYKIPQSLKDLRSSAAAYEPQTVSIGPYHRGRTHLESMEEHKNRALFTFLERSKKPLSSYVAALAPAVEELRDAYYDLDATWRLDTGAFLQLMIVDGCFLLEIMRSTTTKKPMGYQLNDPVFGNHGKLCFVPYLKRDMLMLENQLPLRLLVVLVATEGGVPISDGFEQLCRLILDFFDLPRFNIRKYEDCLHILDFYRRSMLLGSARSYIKERESRCSDCMPGPVLRKTEAYIRPATVLKDAGVRFKRLDTCSLEDISFQGGILSLQQFTVDDALESKYPNMMAFERFHVGAGYEVTSFVLFMGSIIDSARDVRLLNLCGIMHNTENSDNAVASLFSSLSRDASMDPNCHLAKVQRQVARYCQKPLPRLRVGSKYMLHYFNNLVGLSIMGAVSIFALAAIQTLYTVLGYYHPKK